MVWFPFLCSEFVGRDGVSRFVLGRGVRFVAVLDAGAVRLASIARGLNGGERGGDNGGSPWGVDGEAGWLGDDRGDPAVVVVPAVLLRWFGWRRRKGEGRRRPKGLGLGLGLCCGRGVLK